jgi:hypothetical protein
MLTGLVRHIPDLYGNWRTDRLLSRLDRRQLEDIGVRHDQTPISSDILDRHPRIIRIRQVSSDL